MIYGWTGNILHIDLTKKSIEVETPILETYNRYVGGKGLGGKYLRECATLPWNHPDTVICIFSGPLTGTIAPTSGRGHIISKSPLTGLVGDSSVGGKLATRLKQAGWDGIVIKGTSQAPVGIEIKNCSIEFKDATGLWGVDTSILHNRIMPKKASLACIGPAAENGVQYASIIVDRHFAAGRSGLGLCFAQKKIKYILVNGTGHCKVKDTKQLKQVREDILRLTAASPALMGQFGFTCLGTGAVYDLMDNRRMMPTDNFCRTRFEPASQLNAAMYAKTYAPRKTGCLGCHILCKKTGTKPGTKPGTKNGQQLSMPEFETMSHFTALIGCRDIDLVVNANKRCNDYGMDTISTASTLACRREITGLDYTPATLLSLLDDIAFGRGEGKELAMGAKKYAKHMGSPQTAMTVKGMELPAYDPRGAYGMALGYALSTRGGCHLRAYPISHEIFRKPVATDRFSFSGKARIIKIAEDLNAVVDSLTACKFTFFAAGLEEYATAYEAVTGIETTAHDLLKKGECIYYNERIINSLNGFDAGEDDLPDRFFTQHGSSSNNMPIPPISKDAFLEARKKYYDIRGLTPKGLPTQEKAQTLGLLWKTL
ncbi:aldehyde ferredoxin oxidoreductase family protein [Desulfobacula toluolica]|uniref:Aor5: tungsten-containing aldehyde:ferredoxin oxidoreductase n=1 Tax=Desulfobacula toluolica (strain DSM 7467 / Tol2) TaxID=651182 RepID=K0N489_DESTT|nr:aldehyde ferredoxin oxidoreductase C-terminal domain-containing protein [Desulfobacula toluolica]CCK78929.1 Aor5: tungsten-containing aldehyde:ferredoxin oxidoreductase [Desulfobacula toluolica Tol2]